MGGASSKSEQEDKVNLILSRSRINRVLRKIYPVSSASIVGLRVTMLAIAHSNRGNHSKARPVVEVLRTAPHLPVAPLLKVKERGG